MDPPVVDEKVVDEKVVGREGCWRRRLQEERGRLREEKAAGLTRHSQGGYSRTLRR
jgi:hypothetical protein